MANTNFANQATIVCVESAPTVLTFKKLEVGYSVFEKVAWIIHRIEYYLSAATALLDASGEAVMMALCAANTPASIATLASYTDPAIIDFFYRARSDFGVAASGWIEEIPFTKDFSSLPGGGIIVPPYPLYGAIQSVGAAGSLTGVIKLWFTEQKLDEASYWALVNARRLLSA
jgi:hypothetical protein